MTWLRLFVFAIVMTATFSLLSFSFLISLALYPKTLYLQLPCNKFPHLFQTFPILWCVWVCICVRVRGCVQVSIQISVVLADGLVLLYRSFIQISHSASHQLCWRSQIKITFHLNQTVKTKLLRSISVSVCISKLTKSEFLAEQYSVTVENNCDNFNLESFNIMTSYILENIKIHVISARDPSKKHCFIVDSIGSFREIENAIFRRFSIPPNPRIKIVYKG